MSEITNLEFEEVIDWSKMPIDTKVLVSKDNEIWFKRYFNEVEALEIKEEIMSKGDKGELSEDEVYELIALRMNMTPLKVKEDFNELIKINFELVEYIKELKKDYKVYTLLGDGEIHEGQVWEALLFIAGKKLNNICVIVDNNDLQIDGRLSEVNSPYPLKEKFEAFGFNTIEIDGHDFYEIEKAFDVFTKENDKPTAIIAKTLKGKGVSFMEDQCSWHGKAPNEDEYKIAMEELGRFEG